MKSFQFVLPFAGVLALGLAGCQTQNGTGDPAAPAVSKPKVTTTTTRPAVTPRNNGGDSGGGSSPGGGGGGSWN